MIRTLSLAALIAGIALPALAQTPPPSAQAGQTPQDPYQAQFVDNEGKTIGRLTLRGGESAVVARIEIQPGILKPGWHGAHFHTVGDCSDTPKFQNSKGHVNHDQSKHGLLNAEGPDEGDLPNIFAAADGSVNAEISTFLIGLRAQDQEPGLLDADGSALVIHANEDDHMSQPIGGAGDRVACAVIK
ncbi:superoxide dismutase family protein [Salinarimonas soli]|uniref:Superoxide dismutase [Cu-Zn] n=1 Tax=Salinarimonas soli TaxID=1638099 RepID=A0A5B2V941_9HYPH|nr:superoxide dismutase family protein [Salinarimonas soli]KAA2235521.1 superoxide dismutase family protein [Salinarimonas soli]